MTFLLQREIVNADLIECEIVQVVLAAHSISPVVIFFTDVFAPDTVQLFQ